MTKSIH